MESHQPGNKEVITGQSPAAGNVEDRGRGRGAPRETGRGVGAGSSIMKVINRKDSSKMGNIFKKPQVE